MSKKFMDLVDKILAANDIIEVIGEDIELDDMGVLRFRGLCPFHSHQGTASFSVDRHRQVYYCFGCRRHGSVITFLCEYKKLSFREALTVLAERVDIELPKFKET